MKKLIVILLMIFPSILYAQEFNIEQLLQQQQPKREINVVVYTLDPGTLFLNHIGMINLEFPPRMGENACFPPTEKNPENCYLIKDIINYMNDKGHHHIALILEKKKMFYTIKPKKQQKQEEENSIIKNWTKRPSNDR